LALNDRYRNKHVTYTYVQIRLSEHVQRSVHIFLKSKQAAKQILSLKSFLCKTKEKVSGFHFIKTHSDVTSVLYCDVHVQLTLCPRLNTPQIFGHLTSKRPLLRKMMMMMLLMMLCIAESAGLDRRAGLGRNWRH